MFHQIFSKKGLVQNLAGFKRSSFFLCLLFFFPIINYAQLTADFSATPTLGCAPKLVQFTDLSTGNPTSWNWDLGNGTTSNSQNPSTTYLLPGTYNITLTVSNGSGSNTKTVNGFITIYGVPNVSFLTLDSVASCAPKTVTFINNTQPNAPGNATYNWDFGDGNSSTAAQPTHIYSNPGLYSVTLTATSSVNCVSSFTKQLYINVISKPNAAFTASAVTFCQAPATVNFTNNSTGATTYLWDFGDGGSSTATSPSHVYNTPGTYHVRLIAFNSPNCSDTIIQNNLIVINSTLTSSFTFTNNNQCPGSVLAFNSSVSTGGGTYSWSFGDGNTSSVANPTHSYLNAGSYTVTLTYTIYGCTATSTQTVTVAPKPAAAFTGNNLSGCMVPHTVNFTNNSTGATTYEWDFGDGGTSTAVAPTHTYNAIGSYTVRLIAISAAGCRDTLLLNSYVNIATPVANITPSVTGGCAPLTVNFTASVLPYAINSYNWNFGNSTTSSAATPAATYAGVGTYTVTLNYTTSNGCSGTATTTITVSPTPVASFSVSPSSVCTNQPANFTSTSTNATSYYWTFGDGGTSVAANPSHSYNNPGTYTVTHWAINGACSTSTTQNIQVSGPNAVYSYAVNCSNRLQVTFTNTSSTGNYSWNFGDATTSNATSPVKTYATYGVYTVTLTVTDPITGCQSIATQSVTLFPLSPNFTANDSTICSGDVVTFSVVTTIGIVDYQWNFGDGSPIVNTSTGTVAHTYATPGTFSVKLVITDSYGCKDSLTKLNYLLVGGSVPNFIGNPLSGCMPVQVTFTNQTVAGIYPNASYLWNFGDGNTSTATNPTHIYTTTGTYNVTLTSTDNQGCVTSLTKPNYVAATKPTASFTFSPAINCVNAPVQFTNSSTGTGLTYAWNFGDGNTSSVPNPNHVYTATGTYVITLIVVDANGCRDTMITSTPLAIFSSTASFTASDTVINCPPASISFVNTSVNATNYVWDFGNGNTSNQVNSSTTYITPGTYTVRLIASNSSTGCVDTFTKNIVVHGPVGTFSQSAVSGCAPVTVTLQATASNVSQYVWDFDNGVTLTTTTPTTTYTYTTPGKYVPRLLMSDQNACSIYDTGDTIIVDIMVADLLVLDDTVCLGTPIVFNDTALQTVSGVTTVQYNFGDGNTGTTHDPSHNYTTSGTFTVRMILNNVSGCKDTVFKTVYVSPTPAITISGPYALCAGNTAALLASGANTYSWTPATSLSCTNCPNPVASPANTITYTVTGTNTIGCSATATHTITVTPYPVLNVVPIRDTICSGSSVAITASGTTTYSWSPAAGLNCTNCPNPVASPTSNTTYTVIGSTNGCADTGTVSITVNPTPTITMPASVDICIGGNTQLDAGNSAQTFIWSPVQDLSCNNCSNPVASPATTTTYTVVGFVSNGCSDTASITVQVNPLPNVNAGNDVEICENTATVLQATGAATYNWSPATGLSCTNCSNPSASPAINTTYIVEGTSAQGCDNRDTVMVTIMPHVPTSVEPGDSICVGESVQLSASGGIAYHWYPETSVSNAFIANPIAHPIQTTTYSVVITENVCYTDTHNVEVIVYPTPDVSFNPNVLEVMVGNEVVLLPDIKNLTPQTQFSWTPAYNLSCYDCSYPKTTVEDAVTYTIRVYNQYGCWDTASVELKLKCDNSQLFLPNTFTPNGDQNNDWFYPMGAGIKKVMVFRIYNRWGEMIFERLNFDANNAALGWDGSFKGQPLSPDVFVYYLEAECTAGSILKAKGDITLFK